LRRPPGAYLPKMRKRWSQKLNLGKGLKKRRGKKKRRPIRGFQSPKPQKKVGKPKKPFHKNGKIP